MSYPSLVTAIQGTGGVRKLRVKGEAKGKSGGARVLYLDLPEKEICYLLYAYDKSEKGDISAEEKIVIKGLVQKLKTGARK